MKCRIALAVAVFGVLGGAAWAYYRWAVEQFDAQSP